MADETVGKTLADINNEPELRVTKIKEEYGDYAIYEFKFSYPSGESTKFRVENKIYEMLKEHFKHPKIHTE